MRSMFNVVFYIKYLCQTLMVQVASTLRGASVLKRRKSRNRMESASNNNNNNTSNNNSDGQSTTQLPTRSESADGDVVFYTEEPRSGKWNIHYLICTTTIHHTGSALSPASPLQFGSLGGRVSMWWDKKTLRACDVWVSLYLSLRVTDARITI